VTDGAAVQRFVEQVSKRFGRLDVCVTNAGGPPAKNFLSVSTEEWRKAVDLNFLSVVHLAKAVIPYMQRHRWGRIITITSISVKQPIDDLIMSNAVRAAVVGLVKSLSNEFGKDGILVNNVAPGYTATERLQELAGTRALAAGVSTEQIYQRWAAEIPVRRLADPKEVADVIVWLASERASYVTGQTVLVDGGIYRGL
jgi:3-oxoacyl-[acyl-carrier protein] reductase